MTTDTLLRELEPLAHDARMRRMVKVGRLAAGDAGVDAVVAALEQGGFYERWLALQSCFGSGDGAHALRALADPSRSIRGLALLLLPLIGDDTQVQAALERASFPQRRILLRRLYRRRRHAPIDAFLTTLVSRGDERLGALLPFGSPERVGRHLEQALERADQGDWRRLARFHPDLAADALQRRADAAASPDARLLRDANAALPILSETRSERAFALMDALARHAAPARLELQRLAERRPVAVADRILGSMDRAQLSFDGVAQWLGADRLVALAERHGYTLSAPSFWLRRLPPTERAALYHACGRGWRDREDCLAPDLVALLPRDLREREGRRHLALPVLVTRPAQRLPYAAFLPWDEARSTLDPFIRDPDAEVRGAALSALAFSARFQRDHLADLLNVARARRNEQDPVRRVVLAGLADLPPGIWRAEHLDSLGEILRDALDAPDLSGATASQGERLVVALLPFHPAWSSRWLADLVRTRGQVSVGDLEQRLSDADVRRIAPDLLPVLRSWETREREGHIVAVAQSLGRRLRVFDGLVEILERVVMETRASWLAATALSVIAAHRHDRFATLIPEMVRRDPSSITLWPVSTYLHRRRQDLLTPFLGRRAYSGRFSTGKTRFVLPFTQGFHRWTPAQQETFAETLGDVIRDRERDSPAALSAIVQLGALPAVAPTRLIELARRDNPRPAARDAALRELGRLDAGQGVAALLEALDDTRTRMAIYALRRALLEMPADRALGLLRSVSLEKVTVAKEVVRLLGELTSEDAYRELLGLDGRDLHRDVRLALLRALWSYLEQAETWPILEQAAESPDAAVAASVGRIPADRLSLEAQRRLAALLATLLAHPEPRVRMDVLRRCAQLPVTDAGQAMMPRLLALLGSPLPDECAAAAGAVFATYTGRDAHRVGAAIAGILAHRRALQTAVRSLQAALLWNRGQLLPTARAVLDALARDPLTASLRVELAAHALPWEELAPLLTRMAAAGELHAEVLMDAAHAIGSAAIRPDAGGLHALEAALAGSDDAALRRLALAALVAQARSPRGWDEELMARLRASRADAAPLVAAAAQFTLPPGEEIAPTN
jgi:hypothetical protein